MTMFIVAANIGSLALGVVSLLRPTGPTVNIENHIRVDGSATLALAGIAALAIATFALASRPCSTQSKSLPASKRST